MANEKIEYRLLQPDDADTVIALRKRVRDLPVYEKADRSFWEWENLNNPLGRSVSMAAFADGLMIAHLSAVPRKLLLGGEPKDCYLFIEAMNDPDYRKGMIFLQVGLMLHKELQKRNPFLLYAFPNKNSRTIFERAFAWSPVAQTVLWVHPLRPAKLLATRDSFLLHMLSYLGKPGGYFYRKVFRIHDHAEFEETDSFDESIKPLLVKLNDHNDVVIERTTEYLNWRYGPVHGRCYEKIICRSSISGKVEGYLVYRLCRHEGLMLGVIMEFQWAGGHSLELGIKLLKSALSKMYEKGAEAAICMTLPGSKNRKPLLASGFLPVPHSMNPNPFNLLVKVTDVNLVSDDIIRLLSHWNIFFGDNDVF